MIALYWAFLLTTLGLAWALGPGETRRSIAVIVAATVATASAQTVLDGETALAVILGIDALLLAYFVSLALRSDRYWPLWFAAFCALGVLASISAYVFPRENFAAYQNYAGFWAIPALLSLVTGTLLDSRAHLD